MLVIGLLVLAGPILGLTVKYGPYQDDSNKLVVERTIKEREAASLEDVRPASCLDESLDLIFGEHYYPVHSKSIRLGGRECKFKDFEFPKTRNLGAGGYGTVKLAVHKPTNQTFAVKSIIEMNPDWHKWIRAEECIQYGLDFPFITKLYCTMIHDWYAWLVLELNDGTTLRRILQNNLFTIDAKRIIAQLVVSLEYLQLNNIVIGDLTTANVMIDEEGAVKIIDFGFALRRDPKQANETPTWNDGRTLPDFSTNPYNDWYALGIFIFEMLVALRPGIVCPSSSDDEDYGNNNPNSPIRFGAPKTAKRIHNCAWLSPEKLRHQSCKELLDETSCDLIAHFTSLVDKDNWNRTLGVVEGSRMKIRSHPWFCGFDWETLDKQVQPFMVRNTYNS